MYFFQNKNTYHGTIRADNIKGNGDWLIHLLFHQAFSRQRWNCVDTEQSLGFKAKSQLLYGKGQNKKNKLKLPWVWVICTISLVCQSTVQGGKALFLPTRFFSSWDMYFTTTNWYHLTDVILAQNDVGLSRCKTLIYQSSQFKLILHLYYIYGVHLFIWHMYPEIHSYNTQMQTC